MSWLGEQLRVLLAGVMFLTRVPVPAWAGHDPARLARSTAWFPLVGAGVGLAGGGAYALAALGLAPLVAAALSTAATVWATGAFHEDALADACDGFGGGWGRDQILAIMKDSRVGSYGVVGLALALAAKLGALASIAAPADVARALVAGHVLGRWSSLPLIWRHPYVRADDAGGPAAKGRPFAASVTPGRLAAGSALAAALLALALGARALPAAAAAVAVTLLAGRYFRRTLGGITGDCLGAANQMVELAVYLVLAWRGPA